MGRQVMDSNANPLGSSELFQAIERKLKACMQCGTCTGSCPNAHAMDLTPRALWRLVQMGMAEEVFNSQTFWLCAGCYTCTLRCPRGLPLTEIMGDLKHMAAAEGIMRDRRSPLFYRALMETVRRYGRVRESELMGRYFLSVKNPAVPVAFIPLGLKLMAKGKLSFPFPKLFGKGRLDRIYKKARELEGPGVCTQRA